MSDHALMESLNNTYQELQDIFAEKNKELDLLRSQCTELEKTYMDLTFETTKLITLSQRNTELQTICEAGDIEIQNIKKENEDIRSSIQKISEEKRGLVDQIEFTKIAMGTKSQEVEGAVKELKELKDENQRLSEKLKNIKLEEEIEVTDIARRKEIYEAVGAPTKTQDIIYQGEIAKLKRETERIAKDIEDNKALIESSDHKIVALEVKSEDCQDLISSLEREVEDLRVKSEELQRENDEHELVIQRLTIENSQMRQVMTN